MSMNNERDVRTQLTREKYFSMRPKPLEQWIWKQQIPQAAERVFWVHWEEGMRRGDWCSEMALRHVARECAVDTSTVTRAYQSLRKLGLIRREDPGRDPVNPFRQSIAITEVLVPRDLLVNLAHFPNRARTAAEQAPPIPIPSVPAAPTPATTKPTTLGRSETKAILAKLSDTERHAHFEASRDRRTAMTFDVDTKLAPEERGWVLDLLTTLATAAPSIPTRSNPQQPAKAPAAAFAKPRQLSALEAARVRAAVLFLAPAEGGEELFRQVLWSIEQGALRRFDPRLALNIALKKIRDGAWTRPNRLPPNWLAGARAETCVVA